MSATIILGDFKAKTWTTEDEIRKLDLTPAGIEILVTEFPSVFGFPEDQHTIVIPNDYDPRKPA